MKHFYHGLFGYPSDWISWISRDSQTVFHDLYCEKEEELLGLKTQPTDILVGYSMGGRIALETAKRNDFNLNQLILLSVHPGLLSDESNERELWEDEVLSNMKSMTVPEFKKYWNNLPLFNSSQLDQEMDQERLKKSAELFENFRLSQMNSEYECFSKYKDKITWVVGDKDEKYMSLMKKRILPLGINIITVPSDHRVLLAKKEIMKIFEMKGLL
jgi:2-succinyl-6-hydroxy-2,4-cyclohexadiene-1-carboxylate synthase